MPMFSGIDFSTHTGLILHVANTTLAIMIRRPLTDLSQERRECGKIMDIYCNAAITQARRMNYLTMPGQLPSGLLTYVFLLVVENDSLHRECTIEYHKERDAAI